MSSNLNLDANYDKQEDVYESFREVVDLVKVCQNATKEVDRLLEEDSDADVLRVLKQMNNLHRHISQARDDLPNIYAENKDRIGKGNYCELYEETEVMYHSVRFAISNLERSLGPLETRLYELEEAFDNLNVEYANQQTTLDRLRGEIKQLRKEAVQHQFKTNRIIQEAKAVEGVWKSEREKLLEEIEKLKKKTRITS